MLFRSAQTIEIRPQSRPSRAAVQQALISTSNCFQEAQKPRKTLVFRGFSVAAKRPGRLPRPLPVHRTPREHSAPPCPGGPGRRRAANTAPGSTLHWKSMTISHGNAKYSFLKYGQTMSKMVEWVSRFFGPPRPRVRQMENPSIETGGISC